jgi:hypothetical protein
VHVPPDASDAGDGADGRWNAEGGPVCPNPVVHGTACSNEGAQVCGWERDCTDVGSGRTTFCTCTNGRYKCGDCPHCTVNLNLPGCGIGQVCDAVTLTTCGGETARWASCTCSISRWRCEGEDGGSQIYELCARDASTGG